MKPLALSMGCPVSIGPEIILRYFSNATDFKNVVVVGDQSVLQRCAEKLSIPAAFNSWQPGQEMARGKINTWSLSQLGEKGGISWGQPDKKSGKAMANYIEKAVHHILKGDFSGLVTCPISKSSLHSAGYHFPGHTEMLAQLCGVDSQVMMMAGDKLRVTLATIHCPLNEVASLLSTETLKKLIHTTYDALRYDFGINKPKLALAALNPHAGEDGLFGDEEKRIILPALVSMKNKGIAIAGPFPPDTVFFKAAAGDYDAVICMYHDQGLIPFKLLHFEDGVNVTLGLPIVRTSVDHGTAYDIAGYGCADPRSLIAAIGLAWRIVKNRGK